jgi:integrase
MDAITSDDIRRYLEYLLKRRKLSKRSVHSHWAILSSLWTWAEWELQIPHIIRGIIPAPSYRKRAIVPFTQDEIKHLLDAAYSVNDF